MVAIAEEKNNYHNILKEQLKFKYKTHRAKAQLYKDSIKDRWTFYISLKRQMIKKQEKMNTRFDICIQMRIVQ